MFERFTDNARQVPVEPQNHARELRHGYIGTEHLLLGLISEGQGVAAQVLEAADVSLSAARQKVTAAVPPGARDVSGHIPFVATTKRVLELSLREAMRAGHDYIGTEHLLLGLIDEGSETGYRVLSELHPDLSELRRKALATPTTSRAQLPSCISPLIAAGRGLCSIERYLSSVDKGTDPLPRSPHDSPWTLRTSADHGDRHPALASPQPPDAWVTTEPGTASEVRPPGRRSPHRAPQGRQIGGTGTSQERVACARTTGPAGVNPWCTSKLVTWAPQAIRVTV
jgi:hypothetical protein